MRPKTRSLAIFVFDDVELLDFCGPYEVFTSAERAGGGGLYSVFTVSESPEPITTRNGLSVNPAFSFGSAPEPDLLLIPGGRGTRKVMANETALAWIRRRAEGAELLMSVCTGALVLAKAGLLDGLRATTHYDSIEELRAFSPRVTVSPGERFVDNGRVIVSAGISAGIDMALHVVARLDGDEIARRAARHMEYDTRPRR